jgi:tetratricopeptide (TPR) repeat protein
MPSSFFSYASSLRGFLKKSAQARMKAKAQERLRAHSEIIGKVMLVLGLSVALQPMVVHAKETKNHKQSKKNGMYNFPGVGSFEAWESSMVELRAGQNFMKKQLWDQAIDHFKAAVTLYEFNPECYIEIGRAMEHKQADPQEIESYYRKALKIDSSNWRAWHFLANVLYEEKKYSEAREAIGNALQLQVPAGPRNDMLKLVQRIDSAVKNSNAPDADSI